MLEQGEAALKKYVATTEPEFDVHQFFMRAGFECSAIFKICSFGGREFNCCDYITEVLTDMGKCFRLELFTSDTAWLQRQIQSGVNNGLQIVADFHKEEAIETYKGLRFFRNFDAGNNVPMFANEYEDGFRYYIHSYEAVPYLSTEGISVSPGVRVYSAVSSSRYSLLSTDNWGNCTEKWPKNIIKDYQYSATKCKALCRGEFFVKECGCSPMVYNIDGVFDVCTASVMYNCTKRFIDNEMDKESAQQIIPNCPQCEVECDRWVYATYNSYSIGYSQGALNWFLHRDSNWTNEHVKESFATINIFFRDISYTEYQQTQSTNLVTTLSNIGGNMGMWLGMSVLSVIEILIYFYKSSWIIVSRKRRQYLVDKKNKEKEHEKVLEETIEEHKNLKQIEEATLAEKTIHRVRKIATTIRDRSKSMLWANYLDQPIVKKEVDVERGNSIASSEPKFKISIDETLHNSIYKQKISLPDDNPPIRNRRQEVVDNFIDKKLFGSGAAKIEEDDRPKEKVMELTIDLKKLLIHSDQNNRKRAQTIDNTVNSQAIDRENLRNSKNIKNLNKKRRSISISGSGTNPKRKN